VNNPDTLARESLRASLGIVDESKVLPVWPVVSNGAVVLMVPVPGHYKLHGGEYEEQSANVCSTVAEVYYSQERHAWISHDGLDIPGSIAAFRERRLFLARRLVDDANEAPKLRDEVGRLHKELDRVNGLLREALALLETAKHVMTTVQVLTNEAEFARQSAETLDSVPASILAHPDADLHH